MFLDGRIQPAGTEVPVFNRWTGDVIGSVARDGAAEVEEAVHLLTERRRVLAPAERAGILLRAAEAVEARAVEFAELITAESGVCRRETTREVSRAAGNLRVAAAEAERLRGESIPLPDGDRLAVTIAEPVGVVAGVTPFNRPLNQVVVKVAPAVAAGCAVVVKPSEQTPLTALRFAELLVHAGLPAGMLAVLTGEPGVVGPLVVGHPGVDMVTFTGSVATGRLVARAAAGRRLVMELGGNDPLIVLGDADLPRAVALATDGAFATAGQSCRGIKRIIVDDRVADEFVDLLVAATARRRAGDPRLDSTDIGPLISPAAAAEVERRIALAVKDGATLRHGGERVEALMQPAVLDHVAASSELVQNETFGPVAPVIRVGSTAEAIEVANGTPYGLQAGVVTRDVTAFWEIAAGLRVGAVNLDHGPHFDSPHIPFGGVKASGVGREGIRCSVREMSTIKTVTVPFPTASR
ncbi:aldehyde dehydrogenase family protein [Actinoplanes sp. NPDC048791]|uniref:aldehyde dehydrogenase family protein n=1 Tax=Actinoplanes sp. NPDC048791 TaxID=3154623 RepID=UPI0033C93D5A